MDDKIVPATGIEGDDDNARLVVGRVVPAGGRFPISAADRQAEKEILEELVKRRSDMAFDDDVDPASRELTEAEKEESPYHPYADGGPHLRAPHDKTEEWDFRRQGHPLPAMELAADADSFGKAKNAVSRDSRTLIERAGGIGKTHEVLRGRDGFTATPEDDVEQEGDDFEYECKDGKNLDELAETLRQREMLADIGGLKRRADDTGWEMTEETLGAGAEGGGKRLNAGKNRMELTLPDWDWALADVSTKGSFKYDQWNWLLGMKWSIMIGCIKRHLAKFELGERYDGPRYDKKAGTTGCHHLAMVAWNALALMTYDIRELGEDDRATLVKAKELLARINAETSDLPLEDKP